MCPVPQAHSSCPGKSGGSPKPHKQNKKKKIQISGRNALKAFRKALLTILMSFVGIANYLEMTEDETVRVSLANTLIYVGLVVPVSVGLGLGTALLIEADPALKQQVEKETALRLQNTVKRTAERGWDQSSSMLRGYMTRWKPSTIWTPRSRWLWQSIPAQANR